MITPASRASNITRLSCPPTHRSGPRYVTRPRTHPCRPPLPKTPPPPPHCHTRFHLAGKTIGRSGGRSGTAAEAYLAGVEITDERTGLVHEYTRKQGVEHNAVVVPADAPAWASDRAVLWNAAEQAETRKNSTVAREYEIALPAELSAEARRELALGLAREISERHGVAVDVAIPAPGREGDHRNHHAHLLTTTRRIGPEGPGATTRELDRQPSGEVARWRGRRAAVENGARERAPGKGRGG